MRSQRSEVTQLPEADVSCQFTKVEAISMHPPEKEDVEETGINALFIIYENSCVTNPLGEYLQQWMIGSPHENGVLKSTSCFCIFIYCLFSIKRSSEACSAVVRNLSLQCQTNVPEGKRLMALSAVSADAVVDFSMHFMT